MDKIEYRQLVRSKVDRVFSSDPLKKPHRHSALALCDQFTSITEAEGEPRWTFLPEMLSRAYEAVTGVRFRAKTHQELLEGTMRDYADAYGVLQSTLEQIFSSPKPSGM